MPNITFTLEGAGIKADNFLQDLEQEKDKIKVPIPQVGDVKLEIPPFFAQKDKKGKWKLVNPLTLVRNLATRKGKKSISITRENVEDAKVEEDGRTEAPQLSAFSQRDQNRIIRYYKGVKSGSAGEYQTKNKQRGFPATLYKNARKAGLKEDPNTKTYAPNKKKARATYTPRPRQSRRRQIVLSSFDPENPLRRVPTPPPSPPESRAPSPPPQSDEEEEEETPFEKVKKLFDELYERRKSAFSKEGEKIYTDDYNKALALYKELPEEDKRQIKAKVLTVKSTIQSFKNPSSAERPRPEEPTNELGLTQKELDDAEEVSREKDFYGRVIKLIRDRISRKEKERRDYGTTERDEEEIKELKEKLVKVEKGKEEGKPLWEVDNYYFQLAFKTSLAGSSKDYKIVDKVWRAVLDKNQKGKGLAGVDSDSDSSSDEEIHDPDGGALRLGGKKGMRKILLQPDDGGMNEGSMGMTPETDGMEAGSLLSMVKDFISPAKKRAPVEQTLSNKELQDLLAKSYEEGLGDYGDFKVDRELSNPITQVYYNTQRNQPVVVHRGSAEGQDWKENVEYSLLNKKTGSHFKTAEDTQRRAEAKYGTENLTTIGHSKGALHAEEFGQRGKQIITLNKPVSPYDLVSKRVPENQIDIKTSGDPVSALRGLQFGSKAKVLESKSFNPLAEHSVNVLEGTGFWDDLFRRMAGRRDAIAPPTAEELETLDRLNRRGLRNYTIEDLRRGRQLLADPNYIAMRERNRQGARRRGMTTLDWNDYNRDWFRARRERENMFNEDRDYQREYEREMARRESENMFNEDPVGRSMSIAYTLPGGRYTPIQEPRRHSQTGPPPPPPPPPSPPSSTEERDWDYSSGSSSAYGLRRDPRWKGYVR